MVHFFGIFGPGPLARNTAEEAPAKANFFGGLPGKADDSVPTRLERDICSLSGQAPEPETCLGRDQPAAGAAER